MFRLNRPLLLLALVVSVSAVPKGELVEWDFNLFDAVQTTNEKAAGCKEPFGILDPPGHYAGYYSLDGTEDGHIFYMYFENRNKDPDAPFVFWTNGGPGCSSFFGLFLENGPYEIQKDLSLCWKPYGWDVGHNIVFVEQPIAVGYSYSTSRKDRVTSEDQVGDNMVDFFYAFLKAHPELAKKDLFISGESFGGHYLPAIAKSIMTANKEKRGIHLNLKAVLMGNPWTTPADHYYSYPVFAYDNKLISLWYQIQMLARLPDCEKSLLSCDSSPPYLRGYRCSAAYRYCEYYLFNPILDIHPTLNYYDIRRNDCFINGCYDIRLLTRFMNNESIKRKIGAKAAIHWRDCRDKVWYDLAYNLAEDMRPYVKDILDDGMAVLVFAGDKDLICNYLGSERWTDGMTWSGAQGWHAAQKKSWLAAGKVAGYFKQYGLLTFIRVFDSGHMVPMDQPAVALDMLTTYTRGRPFKSAPPSSPSGARYKTT